MAREANSILPSSLEPQMHALLINPEKNHVQVHHYYKYKNNLGWSRDGRVKKYINKICGIITSTIHPYAWGYSFYMDMQNGSKLEIWPERILIHALQLKLWPLKFSICLYRKPCICNVFHPCSHIKVTTITHFGQNWSLGCLLALYGSSCVVISGLFFLLSVSASCYTLSSYYIQSGKILPWMCP